MNHKFESNIEPKTYSRLVNTTNKVGNHEKTQEDLKVPLNTKDAVKYLLQGTLRLRVCRYCLNVTNKLSEFDEILTLAVSGALQEVTIRDIVASFHPYKVAEDPNFPNKICNDCLNRSIGCYLFTQQCDRAERALRNCFDDIYEKHTKLDPIEPVKKRGKPKLKPNHNIIYVEHVNVIDYAEPVINIVNVTNNYNIEQSNDKMSELECQKCWQTLPNVESLINHENSHPKSMWFHCRLCGKSFVKRSHLRKHTKETHKYMQEDSKEIKMDDFKCNECGSTNKSLGEHLQHNEKHKFKSSFRCLVERKVDSLCAVCLDKSSRLMSLDDVVHLHGGYPGLTGAKRIDNILTATIPGPNQYKYEELLVPHQAKILKLRKRKLDNKEKDLVGQEKNKKFIFTIPDSLQKIDFEFTSCITFKFAKPYLLNPIKDSNEPQVLECAFDDNRSQFDDSNTGKGLSSSSKEMCIEKKEIATIHDSSQEITCKICWIFKSPNCRNCSNNKTSDLNSAQSDEVILKEDCKFCWIFGNTGKCDYCKRNNDCNNKICTNINNETIKDLDLTVKSKESTFGGKEQEVWECKTCLSNNSKNRLTCICCDEENISRENAKNIFGNRYSFFSSDNINNFVTSSNKDNFHSEVNVTNITNNQVDLVIANEELKLDNTKKHTKEEIITPADIKDVNEDLIATLNKSKEILSYNPENYALLQNRKDTVKYDFNLNINKKNIEIHSTNTKFSMRLPDPTEVTEDLKMDVETTPYNDDNFKVHAIDNNNSIVTKENYAMDSNIEDMDIAFDNDPPIKSLLTTDFSRIETPVNNNVSMGTNLNLLQNYMFNLGTSGPQDHKNRRTKRALRRIATTTYK